MSWKLPKLLSITFLFLLFLQPTSSLPTANATGAGYGVPDWVREMVPDRGNGTLHSEIACYALPYGLIGTTSHVLTWYTISILTFGRSPLAPWRKLGSPRFDMFLAATGLLAGLVLTIFTMIRCQQRWQFMLIAGWKALLSVSLGAFSLHVAMLIAQWGTTSQRSAEYPLERLGRHTRKQRQVHSYSQRELCAAMWWLVLYLLGMLAGLTGLISLVIEAWGDNKVVELTTYACGGVTVVVILLWAWYRFLYLATDGPNQQAGFRIFVLPLALGLIAALYSDWVLAGLAENLVGVPSGDVAPLYYAYFAAKRLPIFSL